MYRTRILSPLGLACLFLAAGLFGCQRPKDAIGVSNPSIDFALNETPYPLYVWNTNASFPSLTITLARALLGLSYNQAR